MISTTAWSITIALVVVICVLEIVFALRRPQTPGIRSAVLWSVFYVVLAVLFGLALGLVGGWELGGEYFAGFVVEKSLSIDNLFVFVIIVGSFAVPEQNRSRAVTWGIVAALMLRCVFIALGAALIASFTVTFVVFGAILMLTAVQLVRHRGQEPSVHGDGIVRRLRRVIPIAPDYDGARLLTRVDAGRAATPMLVVLAVMGITDALFALDSIPAVYGVTDHPYVVFAANAFALLGMRPLYFLVSGLVQRLIYLSDGMAAILIFIGGKLILEFVHEQVHSAPEIGTGLSLIIIATILTVTTVASLLAGRRRPAVRADDVTARPSESAVVSADWGSDPMDVGRATSDAVRCHHPLKGT